jgi:hypothetical protein
MGDDGGVVADFVIDRLRRSRMRKVVGAFCSLVFGVTTSAAAQQAELPVPPASAPFEIAALTPDQDGQLAGWLSGMEKWQKYDEKWRNRPVHDYWERIVDRKPPPAPPEWLPGHCQAIAAAEMTGFDARVDYACRLVEDARARPDRSTSSAPPDLPRHSAFLTRIHIDGLWTTTQDGARFYGIVGTHISLVDVGRVQVFGPPGILLLTVPDGYGGRRVSLGYTWGASLRLAEVRVGAPTKNFSLFLNVTKLFVSGAAVGPYGGQGYNIVGLSLAPLKKP